MWPYENVTREQFEQVKDQVEELLLECGAQELSIDLAYELKTTSYSKGVEVVHSSIRKVYQYKDEYYRVDEICFANEPFIVIECGNYNELINNVMEDADPFPYHLNREQMKLEVEYTLGIRPYPKINEK